MRTEHLASAYLFSGPAGVGRNLTAFALAQTMLCRNRGDALDACGACEGCRKVDVGLHPDLLVIDREPKEAVAVEAARTITAQQRKPRGAPDAVGDLKMLYTVSLLDPVMALMPFRPHEGGSRWIIVREGEKLQNVVGNKFLKTLEEPPADTYFVLLAENPQDVMVTIRSRCQIVRFAPLDAPDVVHALTDHGVAQADAEDAARLSDGLVGRAFSLTDREANAARTQWVDRFLAALNAGRPGGYVDLAEQAKTLDRSELDEVLTHFQRHFRTEAIKHAADNPRRAAVQASRAEIVGATAAILDGGVAFNVQYILQSMLVKLREVRP